MTTNQLEKITNTTRNKAHLKTKKSGSNKLELRSFSILSGGRTLSSSPLFYERRRKLLSSCFSNFAGAATSNLFGDFS